jgi:hypothetical protein
MGRAGQLCPGSSDVDLPRYSEGVVDLNAEIAHGALDLSMAKQELNGTHVAGSPINQRRLGFGGARRPDEARVEANAGDPPGDLAEALRGPFSLRTNARVMRNFSSAPSHKRSGLRSPALPSSMIRVAMIPPANLSTPFKGIRRANRGS